MGIDICPARQAWRKGAVEKSAHVIAQRWWRTLGDQVSLVEAQARLDRLCVRLDGRRRVRDGEPTTVGALADAEPLRQVPVPFAAMFDVQRTVTNQALVAYRGNHYAVPPGHTGEVVHVRHALGSPTLDITTVRGVRLAHHVRAPDGAGAVVRTDEHVTALTRVVLANFSETAPCARKKRRPPSAEALAEADRIRAARSGSTGDRVVIDFASYAAAARPLRSSSEGEGGGNGIAGGRETP